VRTPGKPVKDHQRGITPDRRRQSAGRWRRPVIGAASVAAACLLGVLAYRAIVPVQVDPDVAGLTIDYRCEKCGHAFGLSVAVAGKMRRERGDIVCPKCATAGARKMDVSVVVSGDEEPTAAMNGEAIDSEEPHEPARPRATATRTGG
jgi:DNA-directed RNA polymerase subunit RPC12/RpoP